MNVLVVNNMAPFVWGGAEELAVHLRRNLQLAGHKAEVMRIPFQWEPASKIPTQMLMVRAFELWNVDKVIALKFPAYLVRHASKTLWLLHQYRQAYDLFDAGQTNLPAGDAGDQLKALIRGGDNEAFSECNAIFTNSETTRHRLRTYNPGFDAQVLPPPLNDPELFCGGECENYIFAGGRVNGMKRQHLLVEAMALAPPGLRLVVAGPPDCAADAARLRETVERLGLADRVTLDLRFLAREEIARHVNGALACAYIPFDEDSLGYVAMEAANAGKAIITAADSGGVLGLVESGETGYISEPTVEAIAEVMGHIFASRTSVVEMGKAAQQLWRSMDVSWPHTVQRLLA